MTIFIQKMLSRGHTEQNTKCKINSSQDFKMKRKQMGMDKRFSKHRKEFKLYTREKYKHWANYGDQDAS